MAVLFQPTMEFFIPFMFVLAIVLGVLELALKKWSKPVKVVMSLAIAFFATSYSPFVTALWGLLPSITWFFIVMFFLVFILEMFGIRKAGVAANPEALVIQGASLFLLMATGYLIIDQVPVMQIPLIGGPENILLLVGVFFVLSIFWTAFEMGAGGQPQQ